MIDFRYHLVSIASIFLALAVGIVLGAGPLKGTIGDTLTSEVTKLREDANILRADLGSAQQGVAQRDEIIAELRPLVVREMLTGRSISVVALPGASESAVETAKTALVDAGALVPTTVQLAPAWVSEDPPEAADRTAAAAELRRVYAADLPVGSSAEQVITTALGWALTAHPTAPQTPGGFDSTAGTDEGSDPGAAEATGGGTASPTGPEAGPGTPGAGATDQGGSAEDEGAASPTATPTETEQISPSADRLTQVNERSREILGVLSSHGLLAEETEGLLGDSAAIVLVTATSDEPQVATLPAWLEMARLLAATGDLIVAGGAPEQASAENDLISLVRDDGDLRDIVSTLDNLSTPVGSSALPMAVAERDGGQSGHYGALDSASRLFPDVTTAAP